MQEIIPQEEVQVKCALEWCEEDAFRLDLCWDHFVEEMDAEWDARDDERQICLEGVGLPIFEPPLLTDDWWGYDIAEACG